MGSLGARWAWEVKVEGDAAREESERRERNSGMKMVTLRRKRRRGGCELDATNEKSGKEEVQ